MDDADDLGAVHAHAHAVHDEAVIIDEVLVNPVDDGACLGDASPAREHDGARAVGGHVEERLPFAPRQHAELRIETRLDVELQRTKPLGTLHVFHFASTPHGKRQPRLVIVITVLSERLDVANANAADSIRDATAASLGILPLGGIDKAIEVVRLPPVVPVNEELFFERRRPGHDGEIGARQPPHRGGVALVDRGFREVCAVCPRLVHACPLWSV